MISHAERGECAILQTQRSMKRMYSLFYTCYVQNTPYTFAMYKFLHITNLKAQDHFSTKQLFPLDLGNFPVSVSVLYIRDLVEIVSYFFPLAGAFYSSSLFAR